MTTEDDRKRFTAIKAKEMHLAIVEEQPYPERCDLCFLITALEQAWGEVEVLKTNIDFLKIKLVQGAVLPWIEDGHSDLRTAIKQAMKKEQKCQ